jgi:O-antigen ligase
MFLLVGVCAELLLGTFHPFQAGVQYAGLDTGYRFSGTNDPNVGAWELSTMLLSAVFLFINARRYRALLCAAGFGAFFFLILSKTRTSVAAISVCLIACRVLVTHWKITLVVMLVAALFIGGLYLTLDNTLLSIAQRTILLGREDSAATTSTLTGRIPLWTELISVDIPKHPLAGYGYGAFWTPSLIIKLPTNGSTALNGYIDVTLELGMVGAAAYVLMLVLGAIKSVRLYKRSGNSDYLFIFAMIVFHLITMVNDSVNVACFPTFITLSLLAKLGFDKSYALQQYPQVHSVWPQGISRTVRGRYQHGGSVSTEGV